MRLLLLCPHFEPDTAPTGVVASALARELAALGHEVHAVTSLPWYRQHRVEPDWRGRPVRTHDWPGEDRAEPRPRFISTPPATSEPRSASGVRVTRVHPFPTSKRSITGRAAGFAAFTALATAVAMARRGRFDGVLAVSPPITLGLAGWVCALRFRAPLVFNLQDIFPDAAVESGAIKSRGVIEVARRLELFCYRGSRAVTVLSADMEANVHAKLDRRRGPILAALGTSRLRERSQSSAPRLGARKKPAVRVIPNFTDASAIRPASRDTDYRREHGLGDRTVVMYAGNVGHSQPLRLLLAAARAHIDRSDVVFVVNGEGSARSALETAAAGLPNVVFVDYQPAERLEEVLASADVHVLLLAGGLAHSSVPSKLYSILAAARPVLASVDPGTEVQRVVDAAGCGLAVAADDEAAFVAAVGELIDDVDARRAMGDAGRAFIERWPTARDVAMNYETLFGAGCL